jgi:hypothetical protein
MESLAFSSSRDALMQFHCWAYCPLFIHLPLELTSLQEKWLFPTFFFFQVLVQIEKVRDEKFHSNFSDCQ